MAIGGAGHMVHRDIAEFLVQKGGRMDIFVAATLGKRTELEPSPDNSVRHEGAEDQWVEVPPE
jgi:hypothetical protein